MLYKHLILALLAATVAVARPQDVDALDEVLTEIPDDIVEGDGPIEPSAKCSPGPAPAGCNSDEWCKPNPGQGGTCQSACTGNPAPRDPQTNECPAPTSSQTTPVKCSNHACTYSTCSTTATSGPLKCTSGTCTLGADGVYTCVTSVPPPCTTSPSDSCAAGSYCSSGTCKPGCKPTGTVFAATADAHCPNTPTSSQTAPVLCQSDHTCKYSTCSTTATSGPLKCTSGTCTKGTDGLYTCVVTPACTTSPSDSCAAGSYCSSGTCKPGCKPTGTVFTTTADAHCPNAAGTGDTTPILCKSDHTCQYSKCSPTATSGPLKCTSGTCTKGTDGLYTCVVTPPTTTKCNAYKKCPTGQYCHHKECKPGCDKKWSKCKTATITKGICDGKHSCFKVEDKKTGASCRKDKDCNSDYKCVRDHGHDSHCHKAVGDKAACNQKDVLFPDVCKKGFECKRQADKSHKCVKEEHKQHDKYKH